MKVKIIVDSTADMRPEIAAKVGIVPLSVHFGEQEYISGVNINPKLFYEMLVESDTLPTTSQPAPYRFEEAFEKTVAEGYEVVCLTCSGKLSGTNQSANIAAAEFEGKVHVVDSGTVAIGLGILAEYAVGLAEQGLSAEEIGMEAAAEAGENQGAGLGGYPGVSEKGRPDFFCGGTGWWSAEHQAGDFRK